MKKNKSKNKILPSIIENEILKRFSNIFNIIDNNIAIGIPIDNKERNDVIPYGIIANTISSQIQYNCDILTAQNYAAAIHAIAIWRKNKQIYEFDNTIAQMLIEDFNEDQNLPISLFYQMPFDSLYLNINKSDFSAFVTKDYSFNKNKQTINSIRIYIPKINYSISFPIVEKMSIKQAIQTEQESMLFSLNDSEYIESIKIYYHGIGNNEIKDLIRIQFLNDWESHKKDIISSVALAIYLCAQNAEIDNDNNYKNENSLNKATDDKNNIIDRKKSNSFKTRNIKVGYRIGATIRESLNKQSGVNNLNDKTCRKISIHSKKSAHIRRGHYHHYWTGSKKDGTQKLILKWTPPTFVNATNEDEIIPTKHKVKG